MSLQPPSFWTGQQAILAQMKDLYGKNTYTLQYNTVLYWDQTGTVGDVLIGDAPPYGSSHIPYKVPFRENLFVNNPLNPAQQNIFSWDTMPTPGNVPNPPVPNPGFLNITGPAIWCSVYDESIPIIGTGGNDVGTKGTYPYLSFAHLQCDGWDGVLHIPQCKASGLNTFLLIVVYALGII